MSQRGVYGKPLVGADVYYVQRGSSLGTWIVGGLLVGGAVLWARHQSDQIAKLYARAGLPHESFARSLGARTRELSGTARDKFNEVIPRLGAKKELEDGL